MADLIGLLVGVAFLVVLALYIAYTARILAQGDRPDPRDRRHG